MNQTDTLQRTIHIDEMTADTVVAVDPNGILCHALHCTDYDVATATRGAWGEGFFPSGCCIEVDVATNGITEAVREHVSGNGRGAGAPEIEDGADETVEQFIEFLSAASAKLTNDDMTKARIKHSKTYLDGYKGTFDFLTDLQTRRTLSTGQARGVANCWRSELQRQAKQDATKATAARHEQAGVAELDLSGIPAGMYAVPGSDGRLKVKIDNVTKGKWAGWVFVKDGAEYGYGDRYGKQAPGSTYMGDIVEELAIIAADPMAAAAAYGHLTSSCGLCGRVLEDEDSIKRGLGPVCAKKFGAV